MSKMQAKFLLELWIEMACKLELHGSTVSRRIWVGYDRKWRSWKSESMPKVQVTIRKDWWMLTHDVCCLLVRMVLGMWIFVSLTVALRTRYGINVWDDWWHFLQQAKQMLSKHSTDRSVHLHANRTVLPLPHLRSNVLISDVGALLK